MQILSFRLTVVLCSLCIQNVQFGIISEIICIKNFQNCVLGGSTADVAANTEIRTILIVVDGKEIIIKIAAVVCIVMTFLRRFMTIRRFLFKFIRGLGPYNTWVFFYKMRKLG